MSSQHGFQQRYSAGVLCKVSQQVVSANGLSANVFSRVFIKFSQQTFLELIFISTGSRKAFSAGGLSKLPQHFSGGIFRMDSQHAFTERDLNRSSQQGFSPNILSGGSCRGSQLEISEWVLSRHSQQGFLVEILSWGSQ